MLRVPNSVLSGIGALFAVLVYSEYRVDAALLAIAFTTGFTVTGASMIVNDIVDLQVDRVNKPWKPLPRGEADVGKSWLLASILVATALLANTFLGLKPLAVTVFYTAIGLSYSFLRGESWSHLLVAASTTGPIIYGYVAAGNPRGDIYFTLTFTAVIFTVNLGREFMKAIQDYRGDLEHGYKTIATTLGVEKASQVMLATGLTGSIMGALTIIMENSIIYKALITTAALIYAYNIYQAYLNRDNKETLDKPRKNTLIAMYTGIIAFWLSKIH